MKKFLFLLFAFMGQISFLRAQPGSLDNSFGNGGIVIKNPESNLDYCRSSIIQPDNKILIAGSSASNLMLARFNSNGSIDSTFGDNGKVLSNFDFSTAVAMSIVLQSDNKIVVTGAVYGNNYTQILLARYLTNGVLDSSFGDNGKAISNLVGSWQGQSVNIQLDQKIVVLAYASFDGHYINTFGLVRFNVNGSIDSSFGTNGLQKSSLGDQTTAWSMQISKDQKVLICGYKAFYVVPNQISDSIFVMRFNQTGIPDSSFGVNSISTAYINSQFDYHTSLLIDKDERILASGFSSNGFHGNFALVRFTKEGLIDSSFASNGISITSINNTSEISYGFDNAFSIALQSDGKIVQAGAAKGENNIDFGLIRLTPDGLLDSSFGKNGISVTSISSLDDLGYSLSIQQDGKIILAGNSYEAQNYQIEIARYNTETVVPVELLSFNAFRNNNSVKLLWKTVTEINNDYYIIERSNKINVGFSNIGKVYSNGNSNQLREYSFEDLKPFAGINYYRLKQVDKDGEMKISKVVVVNFNSTSLIRIYPNPANSFLNIDGLTRGVRSIMAIYNSNGEIVGKASTDDISYSWNIMLLSAGTYYLKVNNGRNESVLKFVKR